MHNKVVKFTSALRACAGQPNRWFVCPLQRRRRRAMDSNDEFLELVQKHKSAHASVSLSSRVVDDLGIDGDDAEELIEELIKLFN